MRLIKAICRCFGIGDVKLDTWIERLLHAPSAQDKFSLNSDEVRELCVAAERVLLREKTLLRLGPAEYLIVGDIHGQFHDLVHILNKYGMPPKTRYIFLGDYVDRGPKSLEVMSLLLAMKLRWPSQVYLLRGNHETQNVSSIFGFKDECTKRSSAQVFDYFNDVFDALPLAACVNCTFLAHGGISPSIYRIEEIEKHIKRPVQVTPHCDAIITDLLWADPSLDIDSFANNPRGTSYIFGVKAAQQFLATNGLKRMIRAHTAQDRGYEILGENEEIITVFSCHNYKGNGGNGAVVKLKPDGSYDIQLLYKSPINVVSDSQFKLLK